MKNLILGILLTGGMIFAVSNHAEAGHGRRRVRRSHPIYRSYTPIYRSYRSGYRPRYYYGGTCGTYGGYSYYGGSGISVYGRGWGFRIH